MFGPRILTNANNFCHVLVGHFHRWNFTSPFTHLPQFLRFTARAVPRESAPTAFQEALRSFDLLHPDSNPTFTTKPIVFLPSIHVINSFKFILLG
jgi:hypothetical protein